MSELDWKGEGGAAEGGGPSRSGVAPGKRAASSSRTGSAASPEAEAATTAVASRGSGQPLAPGPAQFFGKSYGADFSGVRVHTDSGAADKAGAQAFTYGSDIFFGGGQYQPDTNHGAFVIGHELAHVAQQGSEQAVQPMLADDGSQQALEVGSESDPAESEASGAARAAMRGGRVSISRSPAAVRFFKQGTGEASEGGHAYMTEQALQGMGLNPTEARAGRQGNWARDLSQAIMPATRGLAGDILPILNILSIKDFQRGFSFEEFGTYDPVEHIDNPALLRGDGAFAQGPMPSQGDNSDIEQSEVLAPGANGDPNYAADAGTADQAYADIDTRYARTNMNESEVMNPQDAAAYHVDDSGIPRYMHTSKELLKTQLKNAARLGRHDNNGRGPRLFSSAVHIMQDFYAHSNFCEAAVNILIRDGTLQVRNEAGQLETLDASRGVINTQMHANDANGNPVAANLMRTNAAGETIETLTTGSFTLTDTAASVMEEVSDKWKQFNPFVVGSKEPSELTGACLDYVEMTSPDDFNAIGAWIAGKMRAIISPIEAVASTAAGAVEGAGNAGGGAIEGAGEVASWGLGLLNEANSWAGGSDNYFSEEQQAVTGVAGVASRSVRGATGAAADGIRSVITALNGAADSMEAQEHMLRTAYEWVHNNINPMDAIIAMARRIPGIGPEVAELLEKGSEKMKKYLEEKLGAAWNKVVDLGVEALNAFIAVLRANTNMDDKKNAGVGDGVVPWIERKFGAVGDMYENGHPTNGIAPDSYSVPSHTEIGKDHPDLSQGAHDHEADQGHERVSREEAAEGHHHSREGEDHHGHNHEGAFLANLAEQLASMATVAMGEPVSRAWDMMESSGVDDGATFETDIETAVNTYFNHPSACSYWVGPVRAAAGGVMGPGILEHLSTAAAGDPIRPDPGEGPARFAGPGNDANVQSDLGQPDTYDRGHRTDLGD